MEGLAEYGGNAVMEEGQKARYSQDRKMFVRFYVKPVRNNFQSTIEGRPVFDNVEYVEIRIPGDRNSIFNQPVKEEHKIRFADRYKFFKENEENLESGTPLSEWTQMTPSLVEELKYFGVRTVEQLAEMDDNHGQRIPNFNTIKNNAILFLERAKDEADANKMASALKERDDQLAEMRKEIEELKKNAAPKKTTRSRKTAE